MTSKISGPWTVEFLNAKSIRRKLKAVSDLAFAQALASMVADLEQRGTGVFADQTAKWLGSGLAEYRYFKFPDLLIRFFFCVRAGQVFVIFAAYDKNRFPSKSQQQVEIAKARKIMKGL